MNTEKERVLPVVERKVCPGHPGIHLKTFYLDEYNVTIKDFAEMIGVSRKAISAIVNERKSVTPEMAIRFSMALKTTAELWLNLQKNYDLWQTVHGKKKIFEKIKPLAALV